MRRHRPRNLIKQIVIIFLLVVLGAAIFSISVSSIRQGQIPMLNGLHIGEDRADESLGWELILVNRSYSVPNDYKVDLVKLSNGEQVDSRIYPELQNMFDDARADGLHLFVKSGYRTIEEQQQIMLDKIMENEENGYSKSEAEKLAKKYVAIPGTSEHQLGLSIDINAETSDSSSEAVYAWLAENSYKYGFIKRYSADKTHITGTYDEPWHYRYVGKNAAKEIKERGLCLEEYVEQLEP